MIENKPSIYNQPSVYNQGGGGRVEIDGIIYPTVTINGVEWMTQNLLYVNRAWGNSNTDGSWFTANQQIAPNRRRLIRFGFFYRKNQLNHITNLVDLKGFRIPTKSDFETLLDINGDSLKSTEFWQNVGTNETGLSLVANGHFTENSFNGNNSYCQLWTNTQENGDNYIYQLNDSNTQSIYIEDQSWAYPIRLCK